MKKFALLVSVGALSLPALVQANTVFSEGFAGSTVASATPAAPTASSTDYAVMSSKNATGSSIGSTLDLTIGATSAGFAEMQALFTASPVTLGAGDSLRLQMTFQSTGLLDDSLNGTNSRTQTINVGLMNSGGSYPVSGGQMANGGMGGGATFVTGNAQNWEGFVGRVGNLSGGNSSQIFTRDAQTDTTDENQDVLFNNSGTGAFDNPTGTTLQGGGAQIVLSDGIDYTLRLNVFYDGADVTVSQDIFEGIGTGGISVYSLSGTQTGGYTTFDSLAIGYRGSNSSTIHMDVSALEISVIPEPSALALLGLSGLALVLRRRHA